MASPKPAIMIVELSPVDRELLQRIAQKLDELLSPKPIQTREPGRYGRVIQ